MEQIIVLVAVAAGVLIAVWQIGKTHRLAVRKDATELLLDWLVGSLAAARKENLTPNEQELLPFDISVHMKTMLAFTVYASQRALLSQIGYHKFLAARNETPYSPLPKTSEFAETARMMRALRKNAGQKSRRLDDEDLLRLWMHG